MSLTRRGLIELSRGFPRVSGDEPAPEPTSDGVYLFSPRERG